MAHTSPSSAASETGSIFLRAAWAACLIAVGIPLTLNAVLPLVEIWDVTDVTQTGQLTIWNSKEQGGFYGHPVEIGDYDNDGISDIVMAPMASGAGGPDDFVDNSVEERVLSGEVFVYKGDGDLNGTIDRSVPESLPNHLTIWGSRPGDMLGTEVFTADIDGDGIEDLLIGAQNHDGPEACVRENAGAIYVVFGRPDLLAESSLLDLAAVDRGEGPTDVIAMYGADAVGRFGIWIEAGDIDGDGFDDIIAGADQAPDVVGDRAISGKVVVVYGRPREQFPRQVDLGVEEDTFPGLTILHGRDAGDHFGASLHARDLNADGRDDLIIAAALNRLSAVEFGVPCSEDRPTARASGGGDGPDNDRSDAGEVYVFFGPEEGGRLPREIDLSEPLPPEIASRMATFYGRGNRDLIGEEITTGDFNGDGFVDLALGGLTARSPDDVVDAGVTHVVYWGEGMESITVDFAADAPEGVRISSMYGKNRRDILGDTLSAADFNNDGIDDLAVAVPHGTNDPEKVEMGLVAIVYGSTTEWPELWVPQDAMVPSGVDVSFVLGSEAFDLASYSMEARDYDQDGYADLLPNAMHGDGRENNFDRAGEAYIVSGYHFSGVSLRVNRLVPSEGQINLPTDVVVEGRGFTTDADTRVFLDDVAITELTVENGNTLRITVPPSPIERFSDLRVETRHDTVTLPGAFAHLSNIEGPKFIRSDVTMDGVVDITDPITTLTRLFITPAGFICEDAADANDDATIDLTDSVYTLNHLFLGGPPPSHPYPSPGIDPTADSLEPCVP